MADILDSTFTAYLGPEFQLRLMWQLLVEPEFAEKVIPELSVEYFDDPHLKRLFLIMLEFIREYEKVPNLQNQSIHQAIYKYKTPNNIIEEESLFSVLKRIELWNERVLNKQLMHDGDVVQKATHTFIKQQEYRKLAELILEKTKNGEYKTKHTLAVIEERIQKISMIGDDEDMGSDVVDDIGSALIKEFRQTIPTGVAVLDTLTGGGLGKGEIGLILTPSGVGKTTLLTKIANTARELNYNVLQIIFEDTKQQIQRKHFSIWSGVALSNMDANNEFVVEKVNAKIATLGPGCLTIKRFSQEDTTIKDIRNFIVRHQKKFGVKFDIIVLDYLDCLEPHKKVADRNEAELQIVKSFEAMAGDLNIPCWSAIQTNRTGFDAELVEAHQTGGSIKRVQKAHFFMSVAKTPDQKEAHLANIRIIKARFAHDGQTFKDCIFNNDTMQIVIRDERYSGDKFKGVPKYGEKDISDLETKTNGLNHGLICDANKTETLLTEDLIKRYNEMSTSPNLDFDNETVGSFVEKQTIGDYLEKGEINTNEEMIDISTPDITLDESKLIEFETNVETENVSYGIDVVQEMTNALENDTKKFEWSGETQTIVSNELMEVTENAIETPIVDDVKEEISVPQMPLHKILSNKVENKPLKKSEVIDLEMSFSDPDEPVGDDKAKMDLLTHLRKGQQVIRE